MTRLAFAAKGHWGYPAAWLELWRDELEFVPERFEAWRVVCAEVEGAGGLGGGAGDRNGRAVDSVGGQAAGVAAVAGVCAVSVAGGEAELECLWVDPAAMGRGVGRALVADAVAHAREQGVARLRIVADPHAEEFYAGLGARRAGTVPSRPEGRRLPLLFLDVS